jgi:hypothetical protein
MRIAFLVGFIGLATSNLSWASTAEPINLPLKYKCSTNSTPGPSVLLDVYEMPKGVNHPFLIALQINDENGPLYSGSVTGIHSKNVGYAERLISLWDVAGEGWIGHLRKSPREVPRGPFTFLILDLNKVRAVPEANGIELFCKTSFTP